MKIDEIDENCWLEKKAESLVIISVGHRPAKLTGRNQY
jgi:hypothetical protein